MAKTTSTRTQILVAALLIGLVPALFLVAQSLHCAHEAVMKAQRRELLLLLNQHRIRIEQWRKAREAELCVLSACPSVAELATTPTPERRARVEAFLGEYRDESPYIAGVGVYSPDGKLLAGAAGGHHLDDALFLDVAPRLRTADCAVWSRNYHPHEGEKKRIGMHLGRPVHVGGRTVAYLIEAIYLDALIWNIDTAAAVNTTIVLRLIDLQNRQYLTGEDRNRPAALPPAVFAASAARLYTYSNGQGRQVMGIATRLDDMNWLLVAEIDHTEAMWIVFFLLRRAGITLAVVIPIIIIAAVLAARKLARPFRRLMQVCRTVAAGNTRTRVEPFVSQEANEVADAFNIMLERLDEIRRQLVQSAALAAVGELSASIVHEMRNPLNTIQMNLSALRPAADDDRRLELYGLARSQTDRLQTMLNELLSFGAPIELNKERTDLTALTRDAAASVTGNDVAVDGSPIHLEVDCEQLFRAISNLVENAIHFTPDNGPIKVSVARRGGHVEIVVEDSGPGVPESMRDKIFRPFFTNRDGGTGLGLPNVRKIIELHGGRVELRESALGGAAFAVILPKGD